jgi:hypothetical protein
MRDINLTAAFLCGVQDLFGGSLRAGHPESSGQLLRHWSINKSGLNIGRHNRQLSMNEALVETLEII